MIATDLEKACHMAIKPGKTFHHSLDHVIAANIRQLRDERRWSRQQLADKLSELTKTRVSRWRVIDIEGARNRNQNPRSATWSELAALCSAFDVRLYDLVLPGDDEKVMVFPDVKLERPKGRLTLSLTEADTRESLAAFFFGLPVSALDSIEAGKTARLLPQAPADEQEKREERASALLEALEEIASSTDLINALKTITEEKR